MLEYLRQMDSLNYLLAFLIPYLILLIIPSKNRGKRGKALKASLELATKKMVQEIHRREKREETPFFVGCGDGEYRLPNSYFIRLSFSGLPIFSVSKIISTRELILNRVIGLKDNPAEKKSFQETFKITAKSERFRDELSHNKSLQELIMKLFETGISEFQAEDGTIYIETVPKEVEEGHLIPVFEKALPIVFDLADELLKRDFQ